MAKKPRAGDAVTHFFSGVAAGNANEPCRPPVVDGALGVLHHPARPDVPSLTRCSASATSFRAMFNIGS
jgi:hypothetical protein